MGLPKRCPGEGQSQGTVVHEIARAGQSQGTIDHGDLQPQQEAMNDPIIGWTRDGIGRYKPAEITVTTRQKRASVNTQHSIEAMSHGRFLDSQ